MEKRVVPGICETGEAQMIRFEIAGRLKGSLFVLVVIVRRAEIGRVVIRTELRYNWSRCVSGVGFEDLY